MIFRDARIRSLATALSLLVLIVLLSGCDESASQLVPPTLSAQMLAIPTAIPRTVTLLTATAPTPTRTPVPPAVTMQGARKSTPSATAVLPTVTKPAPSPTATPVIYPTRRSFAPYIDPRIADDYDINLGFVQDGMKITITANIVGGADSNWLMHCKRLTVDWGNDIVMIQTGDCLPYEEGMRFPRTHEFSWEFEKPGDTEITFIYENLAPAVIAVHLDKNMVRPQSTANPANTPNSDIADELAELYRIDLHYMQVGHTVEIHTNIIGGPDSHPDMHCKGTEVRWGNEVVTVSGADCMPYEDGDKFTRSESFRYEFTEPGYHEISYRHGQLYSFPLVIYVDKKANSPGLISPEEAALLKEGTHAHVKGMFYVDGDGKWGLCGQVFSSYPPVCAPPIRIEIPSRLKPRDLESQNGVSWSIGDVIFAGTMRDGVLIVER